MKGVLVEGKGAQSSVRDCVDAFFLGQSSVFLIDKSKPRVYWSFDWMTTCCVVDVLLWWKLSCCCVNNGCWKCRFECVENGGWRSAMKAPIHTKSDLFWGMLTFGIRW